MKKYLISSALATFVFASSAQAAVLVTLTGNPTTGPAFFTSIGSSQVVLDGSLIRVGTFDAPPNPSGTFVEFAASFKEFARTTMGNTTNTNTGHVVRQNIAGQDTPESPLADSAFIGKTIYVWVYSDANGDLTGTEPQGVFATTLTYQDQLAAVSTSMTGYVNAFGQTVIPGGTLSSVAINAANGQVTRFNLAFPVPEPASIASLGLVAAFGFMRRRR